jgi:ABC-type Mn2+/Zn2+ transport system ATPase subunit
LQKHWVVKAERLTFGYGRHALFRELSFEVAAGQILGIVGPNGCGKTTLLRTILGLLRPLGGRVDRQPGSSFSYVPQRERIDRIIPVTALEVVLMGPDAKAPALQRVRDREYEAASLALRTLGVEALGHTLFRNLSTGQQQRVLLARGLAADPSVLVLDEPTTGMDVASESATIDFLRDLNRRHGLTILIVTHLLPVVLNLASSIMLMSSDSILQGAVDDVLQEDRLTALYGVPVRLGVVAGQRTVAVQRAKGRDV